MVYNRPHVFEFIHWAFQHFHLAVWTSSSERYADGIVTALFGTNHNLKFVWSRKKCVQKFNAELHEYDYIKDLNKVKRKGYPLEQVIIVDDTPAKLRRQYGNLVRIRPFEGNKEDADLRYLQDYLLELKRADNIRRIEKRGWHNRYASN